MKKILCTLLTLILLFSYSGCSREKQSAGSKHADNVTQAVDWMPFGLEFGMTYNEFASKLKSAGIAVSALKRADANAGYVVDGIFLDTKDPSHWEFLHSKMISTLAESDDHDDISFTFYDGKFDYLSPKVYFSFNQQEELYEFYFAWSFFVADDEFAQLFVSDVITAYDAKFGKPIDNNDSWETKTMGGSLTTNDGTTFWLVLQDKTHDLDS